MMKRLGIVALTALLVAACGGSSSSNERRVLVDYSSEEIALFVAQNFPAKVEALPGQTILFQQNWTGEPHTVTTGDKINVSLRKASVWLRLFNGYDELRTDNPELLDPENGGDATFVDFAARLKAAKPADDRDDVLDTYRTLRERYPRLPDMDNPPAMPLDEFSGLVDELAEPSFEGLAFASGDDGDLNQNVGQPCFLTTGQPPEDDGTPCSASQQKQPDYTGKQSFYNSGILRYDGPRGNTYRVKLSDDIAPGSYFFYCAIHGPGQLTEVDVKKTGTELRTSSEVAREGLNEARETVLPLERVYREAVKTNTVEVEGESIKGPFAGLPSSIHGAINEFVPRTIKAKASEAITWKIMGADHTVSFDVPAYLPIIEFGSKRFRLNPKTRNVAGGSPALGEPPEDAVWSIDGGTYDGKGFWSSGLFGGEPYAEYTLRISKPGTYPYACLVHPKMIGKVIIT